MAIPITQYGWPFWAAIPVLITVGRVLLALLLGIPTLRLRADYLAIVTIAAAEIVRIGLNSVRFTLADRRQRRPAAVHQRPP